MRRRGIISRVRSHSGRHSLGRGRHSAYARLRELATGLATVALTAATFAAISGQEAAARTIAQVRHWAVYYSDKAAPEAFAAYDLIVLDSRQHPPLQPLLNRGKMLLGYVSLGEVERHRSYYGAVKAQGLLLAPNPNWPESRYVDLRDPRWVRRVLEDIIPAVLQRGFHGIFIDTLDNAAHLERMDPVRYRGMTRAAARLVRAIRHHYPRIVIMLNRAYEILPRVASDVDILLGESVLTSYDFRTKRYRRVSPTDYRRQVGWLKAARRRNPRLRILSLDYWDPTDTATVAQIYRRQRRQGFVPYVSIIALDRLVPEPRR